MYRLLGRFFFSSVPTPPAALVLHNSAQSSANDGCCCEAAETFPPDRNRGGLRWEVGIMGRYGSVREEATLDGVTPPQLPAADG